MANTLMIDTNVILDVFQKREPHFDNSKKVLVACANNDIKGVVSPNSICDIFYIYHGYCHDKEKTYGVIGQLLQIVGVAPLMGIDIYKAYDNRSDDFEDSVIAEVAKASNCDGIITRDKEGFKDAGIMIYTPKEAVEAFNI